MFDELVGKTVTSIEFPNNETLIFQTPHRPYRYKATADCCSESWVESMSDDRSVITDAVVQEIRTKEATQDGTRQEVDAVAFVTIVTDKGYFDIEFRNSSNGYYGGNMDLVDETGQTDYDRHWLDWHIKTISKLHAEVPIS
jgi:hypothetical protein